MLWLRVPAIATLSAVLGASALGCAGTERARRFPAALRAGPRPEGRGLARSRLQRGDESAAFVERALHRAGLRFGTDGSIGALWGYLRTSHEVVDAADARLGDVVFFDTRGTGPTPDCADHAGIVERVDGDGQLGFVEVRGGTVRHSFVDPSRPTIRRDERGQIVNSFLREKRITDPPETRYFAGEMLCAIARPR